MLAIYLFCLSLGGVLLLTSLVLGGGDADVDADTDFDVDADADVDLDADADSDGGFEWSVLPFGSLRFWTFLLVVFGGTGMPLQLLGLPTLLAAAVALGAGLTVGYAAFRFFRWLAKEEVTGAVGLQAYVEQEGRVLLPVRPGGVGKIVVESMSGSVELLAVTGDGAPIDVGAKVLVVAIDKEGRAEVTSLLSTASTVRAGQQARVPRSASEQSP